MSQTSQGAGRSKNKSARAVAQVPPLLGLQSSGPWARVTGRTAAGCGLQAVKGSQGHSPGSGGGAVTGLGSAPEVLLASVGPGDVPPREPPWISLQLEPLQICSRGREIPPQDRHANSRATSQPDSKRPCRLPRSVAGAPGDAQRGSPESGHRTCNLRKRLSARCS